MSILGIHGIGHQYGGGETLRQQWLAPIIDGLREAGFKHASEMQLDCVGYGGLFRRAGARTAGSPQVDPEQLGNWETEIIVEWWREAAALSARSKGEANQESRQIQPPDFEGRGRVPRLAQRALLQLTKSKFFGAVDVSHALLLDLKQVRLFLHDTEIKKEVLARVSALMKPGCRVVIGHSLGSVVAYEALCANPQWGIDTFISLGSPLGIRTLVFDMLQPRPQNGVGTWPNVRRWINVADEGDVVALEKTLRPLFGGVEDHLVYNGWQSHDAGRYLSSKIVGATIAAAFS